MGVALAHSAGHAEQTGILGFFPGLLVHARPLAHRARHDATAIALNDGQFRRRFDARTTQLTSLTLLGNWQDDHSGSSSQFFPWSGVILPNPNGRIPTNRFIGQPGLDRYDSERAEAGWLFEHRLNERWTVRQNLRYARNEVDYLTVYANSFATPTAPYIDPAQRRLNRIGFFDHRKNNSITADQHVEGRFETGPLRHQILAGVDVLRFRERSESSRDAPPAIDVFTPSYPAYTPPPLQPNAGTKLHQDGYYLQDQIRFDRWIVVARVVEGE